MLLAALFCDANVSLWISKESQICTYSKSSSLVKLLSTRWAQLLCAKGTFCLYEGGMLISADSKTFAEEISTFMGTSAVT